MSYSPTLTAEPERGALAEEYRGSGDARWREFHTPRQSRKARLAAALEAEDSPDLIARNDLARPHLGSRLVEDCLEPRVQGKGEPLEVSPFRELNSAGVRNGVWRSWAERRIRRSSGPRCFFSQIKLARISWRKASRRGDTRGRDSARSLDPESRRDSVRWVEVEGKIEKRDGVTLLKAARVELVPPPKPEAE